ncbi:MAG: formimidoylglutamase [Bacteroidota bacterium]
MLELDPKYYESPKVAHWTGRSTKDKEYWHEVIELFDLEKSMDQNVNADFGILGFACDEGVRRNLGRVGAQYGPKAVIERLGKLSYHSTEKKIGDFGTIICPDVALEESQQQLANAIEYLIKKSIFPIVIGGGHEVAYGHYKGIRQAIHADQKVGIINFDAHFDLRPLTDKANSGTPFYQILSEYQERASYFVIGIQKAANTRSLFEIAKENQVQVVLNEDCTLSNLKGIQNQLQSFVENNDSIYITIDLDGFSSAFAPGVSAPSPVGMNPDFVMKVLQFILNSKKVISCDIAEMNPNYDQDNITANLAARLIDHIVDCLEVHLTT